MARGKSLVKAYLVDVILNITFNIFKNKLLTLTATQLFDKFPGCCVQGHHNPTHNPEEKYQEH